MVSNIIHKESQSNIFNTTINITTFINDLGLKKNKY